MSNDEPKHTSMYSDGDPEEIFREKILELAKPNCVAMDIGCGDRTFAFSLARKLKKLVSLYSSRKSMHIANQRKSERVLTKSSSFLVTLKTNSTLISSVNLSVDVSPNFA